MKIDAFITRAEALHSLICVQPMVFSSMGLAADSGHIGFMSLSEKNTGFRANPAGIKLMALDEKDREINDLVKQCNGLITNYRQVYNIVSDAASPKAGEKAEINDRLGKYREQCVKIQGELDKLAENIAFYHQKRAEYNEEVSGLNAMVREIDQRNKSGYNFIPFYGIKYAIDTRNMYNDYRRKANQNRVFARWLDENYAQYCADIDGEKKLRDEKAKWTGEMERLRKKYGEVIELLNILNNMIASLGDFIMAAGKSRDALQYSSFENVNEAQTAIDRTLSMIQSFHNAFLKKLTEISGALKRDTYTRIMSLIA